MGSVFVYVRFPGDLEITKPGLSNYVRKLYFQQSASNSAAPSINIPYRFLRNFDLDNDVPNLKSATKFEHPVYLIEYRRFVR